MVLSWYETEVWIWLWVYQSKSKLEVNLNTELKTVQIFGKGKNAGSIQFWNSTQRMTKGEAGFWGTAQVESFCWDIKMSLR